MADLPAARAALAAATASLDAVDAALDEATTRNDAARQQLAAMGPMLAGEDNPPAKIASNVTAVPSPAGFTVRWELPAGSPRTLISWGTGGTQTGTRSVPAPGVECVVGNLPPATTYVVDVLSDQGDGTFGRAPRPPDVTTPAGGPVDPVQPVQPGGYPTDPAAWDAKRDWTLNIAGAPATGLTVVNSPATLAAAGLPGSWSGGVNGRWTLNTGGPFHHLDVQGTIWYTGQAALTITDSRVRGVQYASTSGKTGALFERVEIAENPTLALGQGGINFYGQTGWTVRRVIIAGFADGMQCSGHGLIEESVIRALAYGPATHNDWCQHYGGGLVRGLRSVFDSIPPRANAHNGVFSSNDASADYELVDCDGRVSGPNEDASNILHANTGTISLTRSRFRGGRLIADVRYGPDSFVSGNPDASPVGPQLRKLVELAPFALPDDAAVYVPRGAVGPDYTTQVDGNEPRHFDRLQPGDAGFADAAAAVSR